MTNNIRRTMAWVLIFCQILGFVLLSSVVVRSAIAEQAEDLEIFLAVLVDEDSAANNPSSYVERMRRELESSDPALSFRLETLDGKVLDPKLGKFLPESMLRGTEVEIQQQHPERTVIERGDYRFVLLSAPLSPQLFWQHYFGPALAILVGTIALTILATRALIRQPLAFFDNLTDGLDRMGQGEPGEALEVEGGPYAEIARSYNTLRDRLATEEEEWQTMAHFLETIIEAMRDGILVINAEGRLLLWTQRAMELLGEADASDEPMERPRNREDAPLLATLGANCYMLSNLINERLAYMKPGEDDLTSVHYHWPRETTLNVYVKILDLDGERSALVVLHDETRVVQLESFRRDFVANITHELKTPLTSIQGYVELLQMAQRDPETQQSFLEIIAQEASRLSDLIRDLLLLAEIEAREEKGPVTETEVTPVLEQCFRSQSAAAEQKDIHFVSEVQAGFTLPIQRSDLRLILTNLVSNGVRYIEPGGTVWVRSLETEEEKRLIVEDDGPGIPLKHQARIFERFYRVHKERSRELGGTGLGLSIVKHTVEQAGGQIALTEDPGPGIGAQFVMTFPRESAMPETPGNSETTGNPGSLEIPDGEEASL